MSESYLASPTADAAQRAGGGNSPSPTKSVRGEKCDQKDILYMSLVSDLLKKRWELEAEVQRDTVQKTLEEGNWDVIVKLCHLYPFQPGVLDLVLTAAMEKKQIDVIKQILGTYKYEEATLVKVLRFVCIREEFVSHAPEVIVQLPPTLDKPKVKGIYGSMKRWLKAVPEEKQINIVEALAVLEEHFQIDEEKRSRGLDEHFLFD